MQMRNRSGALSIVGLMAAGAVVLGVIAVIIWAVMRPTAPGAGGPDPERTVTAEPADPGETGSGDPAEEYPAPTPVGDTLGDYDPLELPPGYNGGAIPFELLTTGEESLTPSDVAVLGPDTLEQGPRPYVIVAVDEITAALEGDERDAALKLSPEAPNPDRTVQRVEMRVRAVAGQGDLKAWDLRQSIYPMNGVLEAMRVAPAPGEECVGPGAPFAGIDDVFNTTVKTCMYVYGTHEYPQDPIASIHLETQNGDGRTVLFVGSDKVPNPEFAESEHDHAHDDEH